MCMIKKYNNVYFKHLKWKEFLSEKFIRIFLELHGGAIRRLSRKRLASVPRKLDRSQRARDRKLISVLFTHRPILCVIKFRQISTMETEDTMSIANIFNAFQDYLNNEQEVREVRIKVVRKNVVFDRLRRPYRRGLSAAVFPISRENSPEGRYKADRARILRGAAFLAYRKPRFETLTWISLCLHGVQMSLILAELTHSMPVVVNEIVKM